MQFSILRNIFQIFFLSTRATFLFINSGRLDAKIELWAGKIDM